MDRELYDDDHESFRAAARAFLDRHVVPFHTQWARDGIVPREVWAAAGKAGLLCTAMPEEYGGGGAADFRFNCVISEEIVRAGASGLGFSVHSDIVAPYILALGTAEQKQRWLPGLCAGTHIGAIAMTEPGAGSDLQGIQAAAVHVPSDPIHGGHYVLNGAKTFITNGINADLVIAVAKTDPAAGAHGTSLLVVERGMPGFDRGRNLDKIGLKAQDTAEFFFHDVRVPAANLLAAPGSGFIALMNALPQERLAISVVAVAVCEHVFVETVRYCKHRTAFGRPLGAFQATRFTLAELATEIQIARSFVDRCVTVHNEGRLSVTDAAMAKWWTTELQKRTVDTCLQLHGGYGYMSEFPVAQAFLDSRVQTIYGGTAEIMKEIIGRGVMA